METGVFRDWKMLVVVLHDTIALPAPPVMQPNSLAEDENLPYNLADSPKMSLKMPRGCFSVSSLMIEIFLSTRFLLTLMA